MSNILLSEATERRILYSAQSTSTSPAEGEANQLTLMTIHNHKFRFRR